MVSATWRTVWWALQRRRPFRACSTPPAPLERAARLQCLRPAACTDDLPCLSTTVGRRWSTSSWFHGGLHEAQAAHPAVAPQAALPAAAPAALPADSLVAVGGAKAQSRFSGKTAIPIATCTPMSSGSGTAAAAAAARPAAATAASSQQQQPLQPPLPPPPPQQQATPLQLKQPTAALAAAAAARHAAMAGGRTAPVGRTVDGSVPRQAEGPITGEHVSRWVFDTRSWRWVVRGEPEAAPAVSDKHLLAARRWGDGRDALGAAATAASATAAAAEQAAAAAAAPGRAAAPAKRQRLQVGAMTGDASDEGFAAVGGLSRQKDALLQQVALPLAHPRLFARLGIPGARGVLLHGPPGSGKTHLARALAAEARLPIVALSGGECAGEQAERLLRSAFQRAKAQAPCLLLLDELDALAPARGASHSEHERQVCLGAGSRAAGGRRGRRRAWALCWCKRRWLKHTCLPGSPTRPPPPLPTPRPPRAGHRAPAGCGGRAAREPRARGAGGGHQPAGGGGPRAAAGGAPGLRGGWGGVGWGCCRVGWGQGWQTMYLSLCERGALGLVRQRSWHAGMAGRPGLAAV